MTIAGLSMTSSTDQPAPQVEVAETLKKYVGVLVRIETDLAKRIQIIRKVFALLVDLAAAAAATSTIQVQLRGYLAYAPNNLFGAFKKHLNQPDAPELSTLSWYQPFPDAETTFDPEMSSASGQRVTIAKASLNDLFACKVDDPERLDLMDTVLLACAGYKFMYQFEEDGEEQEVWEIDVDEKSVSAEWRKEMVRLAGLALLGAKQFVDSRLGTE